MPQVAAAAAAAIAYVGTASAAVAAGTATAAQIITVVAVNVATAAASQIASGALGKKAGSSRDPLEWSADTDAPIPFAFGRVGVAGKINYASDGYGRDNRYTSIVSTLSGAGPINAFISYESNDVVTSFNPTTGVATTGEHSGAMWLQRKLGTQPQIALASPSGLDAGATVPEWGSAYQMSGKACSMITLYENSKLSEFQGGEEKPLHVIEGLKVWDPRQDSTYPGGSGACRLLNPATWVYSANPILCALKWATGLWEGAGAGSYGVPYACSQVGGIGASIEAIDVAAFVYAANVADANLWIMAGWPDSALDESSVLDLMLQAGGALRSRVAGRISCVSRGIEQASLLTVTGRDTAGPVEVSVGQSRLERINTIIPRFWSEEHGWQMTPADPVTDPDWLVEDRGAKRSRGVDYPYVSGKDQSAQLAYYDIADSREPISGTAPFKPYMRRIKPGDCFTFAEPGLMLDGVKVKCLKRSYDTATGVVSITFRQETDAKHDAAMGREGVTPTPVDPATPPTRYDTVRTPAYRTTLDGSQPVVFTTQTTPGSTDTSIDVLAHRAFFSDAAPIDFAAGTVSGLSAATAYGVFGNEAGVYEAEPSPSLTHMTDPNWVLIGFQATANTGGGTFPDNPTPPGGWGGDNPRYVEP